MHHVCFQVPELMYVSTCHVKMGLTAHPKEISNAYTDYVLCWVACAAQWEALTREHVYSIDVYNHIMPYAMLLTTP